MEVLTGIAPLHLCLQEVCLQELLRIACKPDHHPLKKSICLDSDFKSRSTSQTPAHCLWRMANNVNTSIDILKVAPEVQTYFSKMPISTNLIAWEGMGRAGSRSAEEASIACKLATDHITEVRGVLAFTDGSANPNPGPTGAGAAIYMDGILSNPILISRSVSKQSNSYEGELDAINLALEYLVSCVRSFQDINIFTDCQSALISVMSSDPHSRSHTINHTQELATQLSNKGSTINITWIAGHVGLQGNDYADDLAKEGAKAAASSDEIPRNISKSVFKNEFRKHSVKSWQSIWEAEPEARHTFDIIPDIPVRTPSSPNNRKVDVCLNRLLSGLARLQDHMYKIGLSTNNSPICECGQERETVEHYIIRCSLHDIHRQHMHDIINRALDDNDPPVIVSSSEHMVLTSCWATMYTY
jgi:ribonuclease HI